MTTPRQQLIIAVHAGARDLGLEEDARRDLMERVAGQRSAGHLTDRQLRAVLDEYRRLGWTRKVGAYRPAANPLARKVHAMWADLGKRGAVTGGRQALRKWCARQLQPDSQVLLDPDLLDRADLMRLVEALKAWQARLATPATKDKGGDHG